MSRPDAVVCCLCDGPLGRVMNPITGSQRIGVCLNQGCPGKIFANAPLN